MSTSSVATVILQLRDEMSRQLEEAARRAGETGDALDDMGRSGRSAGDGARNAGDGSERLASRAGSAAGQVARLAGAAGMMGDGAAGAAAAAGDLGDVLEVADAAAAAFGVSAASAAAVLGALALAVGATYVGWRAYNEEAERAAEIGVRIADAHKGMAAIFEQERLALIDLEEATGAMSSADAAATRTRIGLHGQLAAVFETTSARMGELRSGEGSLERTVADFADFADQMYGGWNPIASAVDAFTTSGEEAEREIAALQSAQAKMASQAKMTTETVVAAGLAQERMGKQAAAAAKEVAGTSASQANYAQTHLHVTQMELAHVEAAFDAAAVAVGHVGTTFGELANELDIFAPALSDAERLAELGDRVREAWGRGLIDEAQFTTLTAGLERAAAAAEGGGAAGATVAPDAATEALGWASNPLGQLSQMPGIVGMVVQVMDAVQNLPQVLDGLTGWVHDLTGSLRDSGGAVGEFAADVVRQVPEIVAGAGEFAEELIAELPTIVEALAGQMPRLVPALLEVLVRVVTELANPTLWADIITGVVEGFVDGLAEGLARLIGLDDIAQKNMQQDPERWFGQDIGDWLGELGQTIDSTVRSAEQSNREIASWSTAAKAETYAAGTSYVTRAGPKWLSPGEVVVNGTNNTSQRTAAALSGGGGDVHLHLSDGLMVGSVDEVMRRLRRDARRYGLGGL